MRSCGRCAGSSPDAVGIARRADHAGSPSRGPKAARACRGGQHGTVSRSFRSGGRRLVGRSFRRQASKQASKPTRWGHASRVPKRGWRGAVPPSTPSTATTHYKPPGVPSKLDRCGRRSARRGPADHWMAGRWRLRPCRRLPDRRKRSLRLGRPAGHPTQVTTDHGGTGVQQVPLAGVGSSRKPALRLGAVPERGNDMGVRCALRRSRDAHRGREASHGAESACGSRGPVAHGTLAARAVTLATPLAEGSVRVRGRVGLRTPAPAPSGR